MCRPEFQKHASILTNSYINLSIIQEIIVHLSYAGCEKWKDLKENSKSSFVCTTGGVVDSIIFSTAIDYPQPIALLYLHSPCRCPACLAPSNGCATSLLANPGHFELQAIR